MKQTISKYILPKMAENTRFFEMAGLLPVNFHTRTVMAVEEQEVFQKESANPQLQMEGIMN